MGRDSSFFEDRSLRMDGSWLISRRRGFVKFWRIFVILNVEVASELLKEHVSNNYDTRWK